jgi:saccharopine dehydrogenase (NAD+, L-lysine forming)
MSLKIGLIKEGKIPPDNRVALTPAQAKAIQANYPGVQVVVQHSNDRCYKDAEYKRAGIQVIDDLSDCDILIGIKEVPIQQLIAGKTYLFFSHTKKKQPQNQKLFQSIVKNKITLIDFECLEHEDGQRIIGFGFFAGIVGAHNGMMAYGKKTGEYELCRVFEHKTFRKLIDTYFGLKLPNIKIAVTGSGRVAQGILEIMNLMQIREVEKEEFLEREFSYPVYVHLKGSDLYLKKSGEPYSRSDFHENPKNYKSLFRQYTSQTDILMNGVYWDQNIPRLFEKEDVLDPAFRIQVIADVTDDVNGSVPINLGDQTIENPVYGVNRKTFKKTAPYQKGSVDVMAVGNLPNELPRDASRYFGDQLIKYVIPDLIKGGSSIVESATMVKKGKLTSNFDYLKEYAEEKIPVHK